MTWRGLFSDYQAILKAYTGCRTIVYDAAPSYLIPRSQRSASFEWHDHGDYRTCGALGSAPIVIPVSLDSPKQYMAAVIETIHRYGGAYSLPKPYADTLQKMGYKLIKRPWGNLDFVFETQQIADLPGRRHERKRTTLNKLLRGGYTLRPLLASDAETVAKVEALWDQSHRGKTGRHGYASLLTEGLDDYPQAFGIKGVACLCPEGTIVGIAIGGQVTSDCWTCSFRYADNRHTGVSLLMFREMARLFYDFPYEADGSGGAVGSSLFEFKRRLVNDPKLLIEMFVVMK